MYMTSFINSFFQTIKKEDKIADMFLIHAPKIIR